MCDVGACLGVLRPPSPPIWKLSFGVRFLAFFGVHFWEPFWSDFGPQNGPQNGAKIGPKIANFWVPFWIPFFEVLELFGCLLGAFLGLLRLSWEASRAKKCRQSNAKTTFLKMQLFGSLKLLMALLGSSCPLFGRSGPKVGPKMVPKSGPKSDQKVGQK